MTCWPDTMFNNRRHAEQRDRDAQTGGRDPLRARGLGHRRRRLGAPATAAGSSRRQTPSSKHATIGTIVSQFRNDRLPLRIRIDLQRQHRRAREQPHAARAEHEEWRDQLDEVVERTPTACAQCGSA